MRASNDTTRAEIAGVYRALAVDWADAKHDPKSANAAFRKHHAYYKAVRDDADGRAAITTLLDDPVEAVRLLAATHSLGWSPERAVAVLEDLETSMSLYGLDAKYTLSSFRAGTLDLDW